jgi:uncharacterized protein YndB with AHSA1/START domain
MTGSMFGTLRTEGHGRTVRFERSFRASRDEIWAACTDPEQLQRWFAEVSGDLNVGGAAFIDFDNGEHTPLVIRECEPPTLLVADWAFGDDALSTLRVKFSGSDDGETAMVLTHYNLPSSTGVGYAAGWHAYLDRLADQLSGSEITNWRQRFDELIGEYQSVPAPRR